MVLEVGVDVGGKDVKHPAHLSSPHTDRHWSESGWSQDSLVKGLQGLGGAREGQERPGWGETLERGGAISLLSQRNHFMLPISHSQCFLSTYLEGRCYCEETEVQRG